jgi:hypothetical protein
MKTMVFALCLGAALLTVGCQPAPAPAGDVNKRVAELEKQVATLKAQNSDVRTKLRAFHAFGRSPLGDFFAAPEFWQCTYDSSWADCSKRCSDNTLAANKACQMKPEGPERQKCVEDAANAGSKCLMNCPVQTSPLDPSTCI